MTIPGDARARTLGAMLAAVEYCRIQHAGMSGAVPGHIASAALHAIAADCEAGNLDLPGALACVALRAAQLACQASTASGFPLTVRQFLNELECELTRGDASAPG